MDKLLSIIIPSYNMEKYLDRSVGSCLAIPADLQQKLDVVIVNDGSRDSTSAVGHALEAKYPGVVRVIDKPNGNYGSCINAALKVLSGGFVKVLDADDSFNSETLAKLLPLLERCEDDVDLVVTDYCRVDPDGKVLDEEVLELDSSRPFTLDDCASRRRCFNMHEIAYRSDLFRRFEYHQTEGISYTDMEWILEPMPLVRRVRYLPGVLYRYQVGRDGQTMNPDTWNRNFSMVIRIVLALADKWIRFSEAAERTSVTYVHDGIYDLVKSVYVNCFKGGAKGASVLVKEDLLAFDRQLARLAPDLYEEVGAFSKPMLFTSFHPVRAFRRWCHGRNPERFISLYRKLHGRLLRYLVLEVF